MSTQSFELDFLPTKMQTNSVKRTADDAFWGELTPEFNFNLHGKQPNVLQSRERPVTPSLCVASLSSDSISDLSSDDDGDAGIRVFTDRLRAAHRLDGMALMPFDVSDYTPVNHLKQKLAFPECSVIQHFSNVQHEVLTFLSDIVGDSPVNDLWWAIEVELMRPPQWLTQMPAKLASRMSLNEFNGYLTWLQERRATDIIMLAQGSQLFEYVARVRDAVEQVNGRIEWMDCFLSTHFELTSTQRVVLEKIRKGTQWNADLTSEFADKVEAAVQKACDSDMSLEIVDRAVGTLRAAIKIRIETLRQKINAVTPQPGEIADVIFRPPTVAEWEVEMKEWSKAGERLVHAINAQAGSQ